MCANRAARYELPPCVGQIAPERCTLAAKPAASCAGVAPIGKFRILVRHRPSCLILARGLVGIEAALRRLDELRSIRFHDHDAVYIVHERTGEPVDEPVARASLRAHALGG